MLTVDSVGNIDEIDAFFIKNKVEVVVFGGDKFVYHDKKNSNWKVQLRKEDDGIKLEIEVQGTTLYEAMADAYVKFYNTVNKGASNLLAPVIEHKRAYTHEDIDDGGPYNEPVATARPSVDDDISF